MVVRAGLYARISSDREGDNLAISRQLVDCEGLAERTLARKKLAQLNRQAALVPFIGDAKRVREEWATMTLSRQAEIVRARVDHIDVAPAHRGYNRFDPSRLRPVWRG